jgi:hypothetical protein
MDNNLAIIVYTNPKTLIYNMAELLECPICFTELTTDYYTTKCNHKFCNECMDELMTHKFQEKIDCPVCRQQIENYKYSEFHQHTDPFSSYLNNYQPSGNSSYIYAVNYNMLTVMYGNAGLRYSN